MRSGVVIVLRGLTAIGAYSIGHRDAPTANVPSVPAPLASNVVVKPLALSEIPANASLQPPPSRAAPAPTGVTSSSTKAPPSDVAAPKADTRRKAEIALAAAAIAAILIKSSRDQYHATGRPCACPDDTMRNGRACGSRSAYSRPGGAAPLCYPTDVTPAMIEGYRQRQASR
jgi:hypothetical protein